MHTHSQDAVCSHSKGPMGWNCSIASVSHLSQSQSVGHTNTSPPEHWGVGGGGEVEGGGVGGRCWGGGH